MIVLKNILVPTDFSETSDAAVKYARALAGAFGASLHVLHVVENPFVYGWTAGDYNFSFLESIERDARERLAKVLSAKEREKFHPRLIVQTGNPYLEIVRYAANQTIDLIVIGTHGRGPIIHMLMGSVAEKVVRKAPCPVLTVRHPQHEFVMP